MVIVRFLFLILVSFIGVNSAYANQNVVEIFAQSCEKIMNGESKSSVRLRASDKATFLAVKKLEELKEEEKNLNDHDFNVMVYRFVDEYIEDLSIKTLQDDEEKVCVEARGKILIDSIDAVKSEFQKDDKPKEVEAQELKQIVENVQQEVKIKPTNSESLALVHVKQLEYFNGSKSVKYANVLKKYIDNNPYFYLTEDEEVADYVVTPKVLKAKIDALDASNKRLHMALVLEITGLEKEVVSEYQNRFVLFGAEEDNQQIASRLISKLVEQAGDGLVRKIENKEQQKLEDKTLGRAID